MSEEKLDKIFQKQCEHDVALATLIERSTNDGEQIKQNTDDIDDLQVGQTEIKTQIKGVKWFGGIIGGSLATWLGFGNG